MGEFIVLVLKVPNILLPDIIITDVIKQTIMSLNVNHSFIVCPDSHELKKELSGMEGLLNT